MIHGSSHPRTARSACGQPTVGRLGGSSAVFFSVLRGWLGFRCGRGLPLVGGGRPVLLPAEAEGTTDQLPMPSDGSVAAHLIVRPAQDMLDLLVALFDPHPQTIQPDNLFQRGWRPGVVRVASHLL